MCLSRSTGWVATGQQYQYQRKGLEGSLEFIVGREGSSRGSGSVNGMWDKMEIEISGNGRKGK
ncbi:MAG: hypothetical protein GXO88_13740 [Chlorobi bacterium]|nr:hypothetical protein [Chlorobiota bacterium]